MAKWLKVYPIRAGEVHKPDPCENIYLPTYLSKAAEKVGDPKS